jgi:hypothetical protein
MRKESKFKIYSKSKFLLLDTPIKLLKFKHTKWKNYKVLIKKSFKNRSFFNLLKISPRFKVLEKKRFFFTSKLILKRNFSQLFDASISIKRAQLEVKKLNFLRLDSFNFYSKSISKFEYNISILLWRLNIFSNVFESRKYVDNKKIIINDSFVSHNYVLKKGDVVFFFDFHINSFFNLKNQIKLINFIPFVEIDYYNNSIIIIKDISELSLEDFCLFTPYHFNLMKLRQVLKS